MTEGAKNILDSSLEKYVKNAKAQDRQYLSNVVSQNAEKILNMAL